MSKAIVHILAGVGLLSIIIWIGFFVVSALFFNQIGSAWLNPDKHELARNILISAGLDDSQKYSVVYSKTFTDDDSHYDEEASDEYFCIQLESFKPQKSEHWSNQPEQHDFISKARKELLTEKQLKRCFMEAILHDDHSLQTNIESIGLSNRHTLSNATLFQYHAKTKRLFYISKYEN